MRSVSWWWTATHLQWCLCPDNVVATRRDRERLAIERASASPDVSHHRSVVVRPRHVEVLAAPLRELETGQVIRKLPHRDETGGRSPHTFREHEGPERGLSLFATASYRARSFAKSVEAIAV